MSTSASLSLKALGQRIDSALALADCSRAIKKLWPQI